MSDISQYGYKSISCDALSDTTAYTVGSICDENGVPLGITLVLSTLTGCSVSKKAGKYLLKDEVSGVVTEYTAEEVQSLLKKTNVDGIAGEGIELFERMSKSGEEIIEGAKREKEALEAAVKKAGVLENAVAGKKVLTGGITDGAQKAVRDIKAAEGAGAVKQVSAPKQNPVEEILGNWKEDEVLAVKKGGSGGGSKSKIGDFSNLEGGTVDDILDRIPDEATLRELYPVEGGATEGFEFKWNQDGQIYKVRVHNVDSGAPSGSNAANGWVVRVKRGRQYYDYTINDFQPAKYTNPNGEFFDESIMNNTHIPILDPYEP